MASTLPQVIVRAQPEDINAWKAAAKARDLSMAAWIRQLANAAVKRQELAKIKCEAA